MNDCKVCGDEADEPAPGELELSLCSDCYLDQLEDDGDDDDGEPAFVSLEDGQLDTDGNFYDECEQDDA